MTSPYYTASSQTQTPTSSNTSPQTVQRRCDQTLKAAMRFHGGTTSNIKPALDGLYYTLKKECSVSTLGDYILTNQKVVNYILKKCSKSLLPKFEESKDNIPLEA